MVGNPLHTSLPSQHTFVRIIFGATEKLIFHLPLPVKNSYQEIYIDNWEVFVCLSQINGHIVWGRVAKFTLRFCNKIICNAFLSSNNWQCIFIVKSLVMCFIVNSFAMYFHSKIIHCIIIGKCVFIVKSSVMDFYHKIICSVFS